MHFPWLVHASLRHLLGERESVSEARGSPVIARVVKLLISVPLITGPDWWREDQMGRV